MQRSLLFIVLIAVYVAVTVVHDAGSAEEIRVWGGKLEDFKDSQGRIWHGGQNEKKEWGGWIETSPHGRGCTTHERC